MSQVTKLPKGASKWWNIPTRDLTAEQREIKRKYARELYRKKRSTTSDDLNGYLHSLESENTFLKSIIENYGIDLRRLFDNDKMADQTSTEGTTAHVEPIDNEKWLQEVSKEPTEILFSGANTSNILLAFVASKKSFIKLRKLLKACGSCGKSSHIDGVQIDCTCLATRKNIVENLNHFISIKVGCIADCIFGVCVQGNISNVSIRLANKDDSIVYAYKYGEINGNYCTFNPPLPTVNPGYQLSLGIYFDDNLGLSQFNGCLPPQLNTISAVDLGFFDNEIHKTLLGDRWDLVTKILDEHGTKMVAGTWGDMF